MTSWPIISFPHVYQGSATRQGIQVLAREPANQRPCEGWCQLETLSNSFPSNTLPATRTGGDQTWLQRAAHSATLERSPANQKPFRFWPARQPIKAVQVLACSPANHGHFRFWLPRPPMVQTGQPHTLALKSALLLQLSLCNRTLSLDPTHIVQIYQIHRFPLLLFHVQSSHLQWHTVETLVRLAPTKPRLGNCTRSYCGLSG
jgi:hypothetical protein